MLPCFTSAHYVSWWDFFLSIYICFVMFLNLLWLTILILPPPSKWPSLSSLTLLRSDGRMNVLLVFDKLKSTFLHSVPSLSYFLTAASLLVSLPSPSGSCHHPPWYYKALNSLPSNLPHQMWWYANGLIITWQQSVGPFLAIILDLKMAANLLACCRNATKARH